MAKKGKKIPAVAGILQWDERLAFLICTVLLLILLLLRPAANLAPNNYDPFIRLPLPAAGEGLLGIDVSHHQGEIDWGLVQDAGIRFVYLKASEGITYVDPFFERNKADLQKSELPFGLYHFYIPHEDPEKQAEHFVRQLKQSKSSLPPVLDVEIIDDKSAESIRKGVLVWLKHVNKELKNCKPMIYSSAAFYRDRLAPGFDTQSRKGFHLWLAEYSKKPTLLNELHGWNVWQYSQDGDVDGINMSVDLSWFNGDQQALDQFRCTS